MVIQYDNKTSRSSQSTEQSILTIITLSRAHPLRDSVLGPAAGTLVLRDAGGGRRCLMTCLLGRNLRLQRLQYGTHSLTPEQPEYYRDTIELLQ